MCMFCAAVPVAGAVGAKLNADQKRNSAANENYKEKPVKVITTGVIILLVTGSVIYHTTFYGR